MDLRGLRQDPVILIQPPPRKGRPPFSKKHELTFNNRREKRQWETK